MCSDSDLLYHLGRLEAEYDELLDCGDLDPDFTIYESFHDPSIHDKSFLRHLARRRGQLDALQYATTGETAHLPEQWDWVRATPEQTLRATADAYDDANHGGEGYTWLDYLRGWNTALQFALDDTDRPWGSRYYDRPRRAV